MTQHLRTLAASPEDLSCVPSTHLADLTTAASSPVAPLLLSAGDTYVHTAFTHTPMQRYT